MNSARVLSGIALAFTATVSQADSVRLTKADVEPLTTAGRIEYLRLHDRTTTTWTLQANGHAFFANSGSARNRTLGGEWKLGDDGDLCFTWRGSVQDGCFFFTRDGDVVRVHSATAPDSVWGELR